MLQLSTLYAFVDFLKSSTFFSHFLFLVWFNRFSTSLKWSLRLWGAQQQVNPIADQALQTQCCCVHPAIGLKIPARPFSFVGYLTPAKENRVFCKLFVFVYQLEWSQPAVMSVELQNPIMLIPAHQERTGESFLPKVSKIFMLLSFFFFSHFYPPFVVYGVFTSHKYKYIPSIIQYDLKMQEIVFNRRNLRSKYTETTCYSTKMPLFRRKFFFLTDSVNDAGGQLHWSRHAAFSAQLLSQSTQDLFTIIGRAGVAPSFLTTWYGAKVCLHNLNHCSKCLVAAALLLR